MCQGYSSRTSYGGAGMWLYTTSILSIKPRFANHFLFIFPQSLESIQPTRVPSAASSNLRMEPGTRTLPPSPTNWRARSPVSFASSKSLPICLHVGVSPVSSPVAGCSLSGRFAQMHILRDVEKKRKQKKEEKKRKEKKPDLFLLNIVNSVTCLRALH